MDLTASSAVNRPIASASLRLVVVWMGVRSMRCTYSGARVPLRFTFTRNFVLVMFSFPGSDERCSDAKSFCKQLAAGQQLLSEQARSWKSDRLTYFPGNQKSN